MAFFSFKSAENAIFERKITYFHSKITKNDKKTFFFSNFLLSSRHSVFRVEQVDKGGESSGICTVENEAIATFRVVGWKIRIFLKKNVNFREKIIKFIVKINIFHFFHLKNHFFRQKNHKIELFNSKILFSRQKIRHGLENAVAELLEKALPSRKIELFQLISGRFSPFSGRN